MLGVYRRWHAQFVLRTTKDQSPGNGSSGGEGEDGDQMPETTDIEEAGAVVHAIGAAKKKKHGGGPTSDAGKRVSSQNATRHGVLSRRLIVGDERQEDLDLLCAGFRASVQPKTPLEVYLADKLGHISWRLMRLERSSTGVIQSQIDAAAARSRETIELESDALPEDELVGANTTPQLSEMHL